jgi:membrane-associated HD superfamily phosphohydrolase
MAVSRSAKASKNTTDKAKKPASPKPTKSRAHEVIERLLEGQPSLGAAQRGAFTARHSDAACEEMGGRTKSEGVLANALEWTGPMAKALKKHPQPLRRYGAARFAWFLESIRALADAREVQQIADGATGVAKARAQRAQKAALESREELLETLDALAEGNDEAEAAVARAAKITDRADTIVTALRALAALGRDWLSGNDAVSQALVESVGLTLDEITTAELAADALDAAGADRTIEGRVVVRDLPAVNRAEGRVLLEMRGAMRIFANANAKSREVPKLVPGKATRGVLAPRTAGKAKGEPVAAPAAAGG